MANHITHPHSAALQVLTHVDTVSHILEQLTNPADIEKLSKISRTWRRAALLPMKRWFRNNAGLFRIQFAGRKFVGTTSMMRGWGSVTITFLPDFVRDWDCAHGSRKHQLLVEAYIIAARFYLHSRDSQFLQNEWHVLERLHHGIKDALQNYGQEVACEKTKTILNELGASIAEVRSGLFERGEQSKILAITAKRFDEQVKGLAIKVRDVADEVPFQLHQPLWEMQWGWHLENHLEGWGSTLFQKRQSWVPTEGFPALAFQRLSETARNLFPGYHFGDDRERITAIVGNVRLTLPGVVLRDFGPTETRSDFVLRTTHTTKSTRRTLRNLFEMDWVLHETGFAQRPVCEIVKVSRSVNEWVNMLGE